jgi:CheY-like chemotaxis protein
MMRKTAELPGGVRQQSSFSPFACVAVRDDASRAEICKLLRAHGWALDESRTGFHLLQTISGVILKDRPWLKPQLIIMDIDARGCLGSTVVKGLRELGYSIPVILLGDAKDDRLAASDERVTILPRDIPPAVIVKVAQAMAGAEGRPPQDKARTDHRSDPFDGGGTWTAA